MPSLSKDMLIKDYPTIDGTEF